MLSQSNPRLVFLIKIDKLILEFMGKWNVQENHKEQQSYKTYTSGIKFTIKLQ